MAELRSQNEKMDLEATNTETATARLPPPDHEYITGSRLVSVLTAITLVYFLVMLDMTIVATAVPRITTDFHSLLDVGWYGSAYQLASASFQPMSGKIYTYFSTKWAAVTFLFVFELGSALSGGAQSSPMFIAGRAVAGLGSSGLINGTLIIISASVSPRRLAALQGLLVAIGQLGVASGPLVGGALTQFTSWRWCFLINLPVGALAAALLCLLSIPEHTPKAPARTVLASALSTLDLVGFFLFASAAAMFFTGLEFGGNQHPWGSSVVIGLLCGAAATFAVFCLWERRRGDAAMIPSGLLRQRVVWGASLLMFVFLGMMFSVAFYLPIYFQAVRGDSPLMSGVHNLPAMLTQVTMVLVGGFVVQKIGHSLPSIVCGTVLASIGSGLLSTLTVSTATGRWVGFQIIYGLGVGLVVQMPFISIQSHVPRPKIPTALAILILTQYFGAALWLTAGESIFTNSMRKLIPEYAPGVDANTILLSGATAVRGLVSGPQLNGVLAAYAKSFDRVMYLACSLACTSFVLGWGLGGQNLGRPKQKSAAQDDKGGQKSQAVDSDTQRS